ncbi:MAG: NAD(P)-dependent oxidoreductase [Pseudobutyrivibrio sp.]|nr:NAD(P)-dependent oxidoreductase [Pseudobutyrivibrio sp.]
MKKVIVTGASSMLGLATINACLKQDIQVIAIARKNSKRSYKIPQYDGVTFLEADLKDLASLSLGCTDCDAFFHFGWGHTDKEGRMNVALQNENIQYCLDAVKLAHRSGCKVFLGAGSQAEYGIVADEIFPDTPANPVVAYGVAKYQAGVQSMSLCEELGMICIWTRIFSVYGVNDGEDTMVKSAVAYFLKKETMHFSSGMQMWNYLFEEDAAEIFIELCEKVKESGIYHIAGQESKPLREYIFEMAQALGDGFYYDLAPFDPTSRVVSIRPNVDKTYNAIKYRPRVSFAEGVRRILEHDREI